MVDFMGHGNILRIVEGMGASPKANQPPMNADKRRSKTRGVIGVHLRSSAAR
jgi:hypothetical protein